MKVLMVGLGSAGQRHLMNLRRIAGDDVEIIAYRATGHRRRIVECQAETVDSLEAHYGIRAFNNLNEALAQRPDAAVIANPTSLHVETACAAASAGCHLFVEKPLSHTLEGVEALSALAGEGSLCVMVGYQTRFHPCVAKVREILAGGQFGNPVSARFEWGTWLPGHHPYEDFRKSYAAREDQGGGVVLSLSHEIDLIHHLVGVPDEVHAAGGQLSELGIDAEDTAAAILSYASGPRPRLASLFLSFAQRHETRDFCIQLEGGMIDCNLVADTMRLEDAAGRVVIDQRLVNAPRNELFVAEMREFLAAIEEGRSPSVGLDDGILAVETSLRIKRAMEASIDAAIPA